MAKLSALQIIQEVQLNNGLGTVTALTALTGLNYKIWKFIEEGIFSIGVNDHWKNLEADGTLTLVNGSATYAIPTDLNEVDKYSFRFDESRNLEWLSTQEVDHKYPTQTGSGSPKGVYEWKGFYNLINTADAGNNSKTIKFRYWKHPVILSTDTAAGTTWFNEGFDRSVLVNWVTFKTLQYRHNEEFKEYKKKVFGGDGEEGYLNEMRRIRRSPAPNKIRVTAKF